jgi:hypothetical protein
MSETIAVVKPNYYLEQAYQKGYERFEDSEALADDAEPSLEGFTDSAEYANHVLPGLRSMAGFDDSGPGTWTIEREVAAIHPGCEEDEPAEAELVSSRQVFEELVNAWRGGALDALRNEERDPDEYRW